MRLSNNTKGQSSSPQTAVGVPPEGDVVRAAFVSYPRTTALAAIESLTPTSLPTGERTLEFSKSSPLAKKVREFLAMEVTPYDDLRHEIDRDFASAVPPDIREAFFAKFDMLIRAHQAAAQVALAGYDTGKISIEELRIIRTVTGFDEFIPEVQQKQEGAGCSHAPYQLRSLANTLNEISSARISIREALDLVRVPIQALDDIASYPNLKTLSTKERHDCVHKLNLELVALLADPDKLSGAVAELALRLGLLGKLTGRPVLDSIQGCVVLDRRVVEQNSVDDVIARALKGFAVLPERQGDYLSVGAAVVGDSQDGKFRRYRALSIEHDVERAVLVELITGFVEELAHCQQHWREEALLLTADDGQVDKSELLLSGIARRYFAKHPIELVSDTARDEIDVLGVMLELSAEAGVDPAWLKRPLFENHPEMRSNFVRWLQDENIIAPSMGRSA